MGLFNDITRNLFGGSDSENKSGNLNREFILDNYGASGAGAFNDAMGIMGDVLGGGVEGFWDQGGGDFLLNQGVQGINNNMYARGLGKSGAAMKALEDYRSGLASTYLNNYLGQVSDFGKLGLGAGGLVADTGEYSYGESSEREAGGLGKFLGFILASDRRLKTRIRLLRRDPDGLGWYEFAYKSAPDVLFTGVMADEVKELRPAAYVPGFVNGEYDGVNYSQLRKAA